MPESIVFSLELPVYPERVYRAWLDSYEHSQFTGKKAQISPDPGQTYSSLDSQVSGQIVTTTAYNHIVQTWRTSSYPPDATDSQVDIRLEPTCTGCQLTLEQTGIPDGFSRQVLEIWEQAYFRPLKDYFDALVDDYIADMDG
jgi:activator of HSP90 ATPase